MISLPKAIAATLAAATLLASAQPSLARGGRGMGTMNSTTGGARTQTPAPYTYTAPSYDYAPPTYTYTPPGMATTPTPAR